MAQRPARLPCFAAWLVLFVLVPVDAKSQSESASVPYRDRPVFEVLEFFRGQGFSIAYSTNLVSDTLLVLTEPVSTQPLDLIREILKPHGLALKQVDGIYLVIRGARDPPPPEEASLLVIIRNQEFRLLDQPVTISGSPGLPAVEDLGPGMWRFSNVPAGRYQLDPDARGDPRA